MWKLRHEEPLHFEPMPAAVVDSVFLDYLRDPRPLLQPILDAIALWLVAGPHLLDRLVCFESWRFGR